MNKGFIKINNNYVIIFFGAMLFVSYLYANEKYQVLYKKIDLLNDENNKIHKKLKEKNNINVIDDKKEILNKIEELVNQKNIDHNRDRDYRAMADPPYPPLKRILALSTIIEETR